MKWILAAVLLGGCAPISASLWAEAERVCAVNGGVAYVEQSFDGFRAVCRNKAMFILRGMQ